MLVFDMPLLYFAVALISKATWFITILRAVALLQYFVYSAEHLDIAFSHHVYFQEPGNLKTEGIMCDVDSPSLQNIVQSQPRREPKIIFQRAENIFATLKDNLVSVTMFVHLEQIAINVYFQQIFWGEYFATKLIFLLICSY
jgi:hypothetical protein